jgi:hypothetical protein
MPVYGIVYWLSFAAATFVGVFRAEGSVEGSLQSYIHRRHADIEKTKHRHSHAATDATA